MAKNRRTAAPPEAPRVSRTTIEVRPSWLEEDAPASTGRRSTASASGARASRPSRASELGRPSKERLTIDVQTEWLESASEPPAETEAGDRPPPSRRGRKGPPPLPEAEVHDGETVGRSAIPPPLPKTPTASKEKSARDKRGR